MSCFRYLPTTSVISFLLLSMFASIAAPCPPCLGCPQDETVSDDNAAKINDLIRDLRNPKFGVRESASQQLIDIGAPATAALQLAGESDSLEVRVRAQAILASILQSRDSSFGSAEQVIIKQFKEANAANRVGILRVQAQSKNTSLFLHLLDILAAEETNSTGSGDQAESPIETLIATENTRPFTQLISNLLINRNWSDIEKLLSHPSIVKHSPMLRVYEAKKDGKLDAYIEDLFQKFSKADADGQKTSARELISLIGLLRVQRDFKRAKTAIGWLQDADMERTLLDELLFQQGDWQEILRRSKLDPAEPEAIFVNLPQEALLHHLNGDQAAVANVKEKLRQQLQTATDAGEADVEKATQARLLRSKLRIVGAISLDWPLVAEFIEPDNLVDNFDLLIVQNRSEEALELLEIGPTFQDRQAWMKMTLKEIVEAKEKMKKRTPNRGNEDYNKQKKLVAEKTRLTSALAEMMEQRGLNDEAQLYFQMIYFADKTPQGTRRTEVLEQLIELGRTDDYWQLVGSILSDPTALRYMNRYWFGIKSGTAKTLANQWSGRIRGSISDPLEKTKTLAAIVNSPWVDRDELNFDLDFEIARFRSSAPLNASGQDEFLLAQVLELNGRDDASEKFLKQATTLGNSSAILRSFQESLATNNARGILDYWIGAYNSATETCLLAERAALKLLETETDPDKIKSIKQQLKISRLAIAAKWIGGSTWDRGGFSQLEDIDESHLAIFRLECKVYGVPGNFLSKSSKHGLLGNALVSKKSNQAYQGGVEQATVMFNELEYETGARTDIGWSYSSMRLNLALARGMIERGEYDQAADLLVRQAEFSPGDVSVGESTVKELDQAGAKKAADRVYQAIKKYFVKALETYPDSPINRNNFAWLQATSNRDLESARRHAMVAIKMRPSVENYLDTLAEVEFLLGHPEKAFELSKRCLQLRPERNYYRQQKERFRKAMSGNQ